MLRGTLTLDKHNTYSQISDNRMWFFSFTLCQKHMAEARNKMKWVYVPVMISIVDGLLIFVAPRSADFQRSRGRIDG